MISIIKNFQSSIPENGTKNAVVVLKVLSGCMKKLTPLANGTDEEGKKNGKLAEGK